MREKIIVAIISWFGSSLFTKTARGTIGTLAAMPFAFIIQYFFGNTALLIAAILIFAAGTWAANEYVKETGKDDPGEIVVDEAAGIFLMLSFLYPTWKAYLVAFLVFRIFDVVKPWPVSFADRKIKGGFGVMFDDILAALYPILIFLLAAPFMADICSAFLQWIRP